MNPNQPVADGRYVLPQMEERTPYGVKQQDPYTKLFSERIIFLGTQIDDTSANDIMSQLLVLDAMNDSPITLYVNSPGGSLTSLTAIYDTMQYVNSEVHTICLGQAASAAAILLAGGEPGHRSALPHARIMIHQPRVNGSGRGQATDISIQANEISRLRRWCEDTLAADTGKSLDTVHTDLERDKFLTADMALEYGIIDNILHKVEKKKKGRVQASLIA